MNRLSLDRDEAAALYQLLVRHDACSLGHEGTHDELKRLNRALDRLRGDLIDAMDDGAGSRSDG